MRHGGEPRPAGGRQICNGFPAARIAFPAVGDPLLRLDETARRAISRCSGSARSARVRVPAPSGVARRAASLREVATIVGIVVVCLGWRLLAGGVGWPMPPPSHARHRCTTRRRRRTATPTPRLPTSRGDGQRRGDQQRAAGRGVPRPPRRGRARDARQQTNHRAGLPAAGRGGDAPRTSTPRSTPWRGDSACRATSGSSSSSRSGASSPQQYADEIVWPMLALRRLAHATPSSPRPRRCSEAFENQFGAGREGPDHRRAVAAGGRAGRGPRRSPPPTSSGPWPASTPSTSAAPAPTAGCSRSAGTLASRASTRSRSASRPARSRRWCRWPTSSSSSSARGTCPPPT